MKIRGAACLGIMMIAVLRGADPDIEFEGIITAEGKTRIALTDKTRKSTTWVEPGQQFNGYTVARYDEKEEAVYLKKSGRETRLGLIASKTVDARPAPAENTTQSAQATAVATAIRSNLRQLSTAARQYQLARGATTVSYNDLVGPDKLIKELKPVAGENYSTLNFGPNVTAVSVTTSTGAIVSFEMPPPNAAPPPTLPGAPAAPPAARAP